MLNSNQAECQKVAVCWHVLFSVVGLVDGLEGTCLSGKIRNGTSKREVR